MKPKIQLPQHDTDASSIAQRWRYLSHMRKDYAYAYSYYDTFPTTIKLPKAEKPDRPYKIQGLKHALPLLRHLPHILLLLGKNVFSNPVKTFADYRYFPQHTYPNQQFIHFFQNDISFAYQRVAGMNPVLLEGLTDEPDHQLPTNFPAHDAFARVFPKTSFEQSLQERRLYLTNYHMLQPMADAPGRVRTHQQYITAPLVLYYLQTSGLLAPVAIQLQQTPGPGNPIFTPLDGNNWLAAKTFAQAADGCHQELWTHATRIHYLMETLILITRHHVSEHHPLNVLLTPHFKYLLQVNANHLFLKNAADKPGRFGQLFGGDYDSSMLMLSNAMKTYHFTDFSFLNDLQRRRVENTDLVYPYRDDGKKVHAAIRRFVYEYLRLYYHSAQDIVQDPELQAWAHAMGAENGGRLQGFPRSLESLQTLTDVVTQIIFIATAHHSAVHHAQWQYGGFVPNMPFAAYSPPPTDTEYDRKNDYLFALQPPLKTAMYQSFIFYITDFKVNRLGGYDLTAFDAQSHEVIRRFQQRLQAIGEDIDRENEKRIFPYIHMHPSEIPNGVTV